SWGLPPLGAFGACPIAARLAGARSVDQLGAAPPRRLWRLPHRRPARWRSLGRSAGGCAPSAPLAPAPSPPGSLALARSISWGLRPLGAFGACPIAARLAGAR